MLKNRLKTLEKTERSNNVQIINSSDLPHIKGGKNQICGELLTCNVHCGECPKLEACGTNLTTC